MRKKGNEEGIKIINKEIREINKEIDKEKRMKIIDNINNFNMKEFWKIVRRNDFKYKKKIGNSDRILTDEIIIFYEKLYEVNEVDETKVDEIIFDEYNIELNCNCFNMEELEEVIKSCGNNKCPGLNGLMIEMIKNSSFRIKRLLLKFFNRIWKEKKIPDDWRVSKLKLLYKNKGDECDISNYRSLIMIDHIQKCFSKLILNRIRYLIESKLSNDQKRFIRGNDTVCKIMN